MNRLGSIFAGFIATFTFACFGLAIAPSLHYRGQSATAPREEASELVEQGRNVYLANGCVYCHSQQVSARNFRSDQARGWGARRTVASDFQNDKTGVFGTMRTGPDLANIGSRNPSPTWHSMHLYNPQITSKGSIMPPFRFLFDRYPAGKSGDPAAVSLGDGDEIVPNPEGRALIAYLISLKHDAGNPAEAFEASEKQ